MSAMVVTLVPFVTTNDASDRTAGAADPLRSLLRPSPTGSRKRGSHFQYSGYQGALNVCPPCDIRRCPTVTGDSCEGQIVKDECNCCPVCDIEEDPEELFIKPHASTQSK